MLVREVVAATLSCLLALPALAQQQPPSYSETLEIRIVSVDVMVTDHDGNPVTGLGRDDFELFENGKRKDISNFLAIDDRTAAGNAASSSPAAPDRRALIFFIDNTSLQPFNRNKVLAAMKGFVERTMRSGDEAMVISWNPGLKQDLALSNDRAKVLSTLQTASGATGRASLMELERQQTRDALRQLTVDMQLSPHEGSMVTLGDQGSKVPQPPYETALSVVNHYADSVLAATQNKADALRRVIDSVRPTEGRKALVFVTESFSMDPARQMFEYLDSVKSEFAGGKFQNPRGEILRFDDHAMFESVTAAANAASVTLYPISASGMSSGFDVPDASDNGSTVANTPQLKSPGAQADHGLNQLASQTGGLAVTGSNDFLRGFDRIANDLMTYYSLGYRSEAPRKDAMRGLTVKVKKAGLVVRTRESLLQKTPKTQTAESLAANLFTMPTKNDMGITVVAGARTVKSDDEATVPLEITIPMSSLTLTPKGEEVAGKFSVYTGFTRSDGTQSPVSKKEYPIHFAASSLPNRPGITLRVSMTVNKSTETVSVAVVDETSNATGFESVRVQ